MEARRVPMGFRIFIGVAIFLLVFLLARPSDPATKSQIDFWKKTASLFGESDIEGFVGIALLTGCTIFTILCYKIVIRQIEKKLNNK
ncbi:hypothetical protein IBT47_08085 [Erwinia sp. S43]|uniref:hypothetical protein n=1 Tax=unclassified Erwinia TaxID=2622719 RepID=UPI00190A0D11|nr:MULTISPECIES: hypothetical protein [unclassified Erwinia]MBK0032239.1 hypothetical protein [Erwinia sp. S43]MCW1876150.1 hypothetical protein [Erwinia sp. INIA01]